MAATLTPKERAERLLYKYLDREQRKQFKKSKKKGFAVKIKKGECKGYTAVITSANINNIGFYTKKGNLHAVYCVAVYGGIPKFDKLLTFKTMLELDPDKVINVGIRQWAYRPDSSWPRQNRKNTSLPRELKNSYIN